MLWQWAGAQEATREDGWDSWSELARWIFCTRECHAPRPRLGGVDQEGTIPAQDVEWLYWGSLACLRFYPSLSLSVVPLFIILLSLPLLLSSRSSFFFLSFISVSKPLLSWPMVSTSFQFSSPSHQGWSGEWMSSYMVFSCQLGINHDNYIQRDNAGSMTSPAFMVSEETSASSWEGSCGTVGGEYPMAGGLSIPAVAKGHMPAACPPCRAQGLL